ncbi:MAG: ATP-binding protein [Desulfobacterales bacterium]|nr:ATP-binding protein [Desulfobacterales bacterium]
MMRLSFDFPASTAVLGKIGELAADAGREAGFSDVEIGDIQLAIDEACTNTIIHGLKKDPERIFRLVLQWKSDNIEILIHESGEPFDPDKVRKPDTDACLENRPIGGLGIYFVRKIMDEVEYRVDADGVKTLRMVKRKK